MIRNSLFPVIGAALFAAGCVPVTEPVGDISKAEPDKALVGTWTVTDGADTAKALDVKAITVDVPEVKGNPKGFMRAVLKSNDTEMWFFTTTVGKHTYVSLILATNDPGDPPKFSKQGMFEEWKKLEHKRFFIFRYARDGDKLTIDCGNNGVFTALMKDANIKAGTGGPVEIYKTPVGWLANYLDKTGPAKLFDKTNYLELKREKKE
jgi:hypothetical protein